MYKRQHERVLVLGGDHGITYAVAEGLHRTRRLGGLAYVDVHWDLRPWADSHSSGSSFRRILDRDLLPAEHLAPIGIQRPRDPAALARSRFDELRAFAEGRGVAATSLEEATGRTLAQVLRERLGALPAPRHLSIDIDAIDADEAPGVSAPGPGRFRRVDVVSAAARAAPLAASADIVETSPPLDPSGRTVEAAADVAQAILEAWTRPPPASPH